MNLISTTFNRASTTGGSLMDRSHIPLEYLIFQKAKVVEEGA
jgi:hypothetical protein